MATLPICPQLPLKEVVQTKTDNCPEKTNLVEKPQAFAKILNEKKAEIDKNSEPLVYKETNFQDDRRVNKKLVFLESKFKIEETSLTKTIGKSKVNIKRDLLKGENQNKSEIIEDDFLAKSELKKGQRQKKQNEKFSSLTIGSEAYSINENKIKDFKIANENQLKLNSKQNDLEKVISKVIIIDLRKEKESETLSLEEKYVKRGEVKKENRGEFILAKKDLDIKDNKDIKYYQKIYEDSYPVQKVNLSTEKIESTKDWTTRFQEIVRQEVVKQTAIIVKDGGQGEIQLILKPENLGSVRIKLNIEDNHIAGKIIVDNNSVKQIMEQNLANLENALKDNGYENSAFQVFVAGQNAKDQKQHNKNEEKSDLELQFLANKQDSYELVGASIFEEAAVNIIL